MMKQILIIVLCTLSIFSQKEKETVYVLFDNKSIETFKTEDGVGNFLKLKKYRKENKNGEIIFYIENEKFVFNENKDLKDTCNIDLFKKIKTVDIVYMNKKKEQNTIKWYNPFKKIFLIEMIDDKKIIKYEVRWIDEWVTID